MIENGGVITNDQSSLGNGYVIGYVAPQGYTDIDLNSHAVVLNVNQGIAPVKDSGLNFLNVRFNNGSLIKTGPGQMLIDGNSTIPNLALLEGGVQFGRPGNPATISSAGIIDIEPTTFALGAGTIGSAGDADLYNAGSVIIGFYSEQGTLSISGNYEQESSGSLLIQGTNENNVNKLTVSGEVYLNGTLYFSALPQSNFSAGDEVALLIIPVAKFLALFHKCISTYQKG